MNARAHAIVASEPMAALTFADLAQVVANALPDDTYPNNAVYELRGTAWKERANALLRLGELDAALESLRRAERDYGRLQSSGHGLAAVELVRAATYYQRGELQRAADHAERAEHGFAHLGQPHRRVKALYLRGSIKLESLDLEAAGNLYQQVVDYGEELNDVEWIAKGSFSRGVCELRRGKLSDAAMLFNTALVIFRETGPTSDRISSEWGLARVVLDSGKPSEAVQRLRDVMTAFEELGMVMDAAEVGLDMADALPILDRPEQIVKVAEHSFRVLKKAGVLNSALTALAYLKEAAAARQLEPKAIQGIRTFLRKAERDPELLFVPPINKPD